MFSPLNLVPVAVVYTALYPLKSFAVSYITSGTHILTLRIRN